MQKKLGEIHFSMRNETCFGLLRAFCEQFLDRWCPLFGLFLGILLLHFCPISDFFHHLQCNTVAKTLPSLFFWCPLPVLQVSSRLEHFEFFFFQGSPLCIIFRFWSLRPQQGARPLQNHFPAYFFDGPHQSCKFRLDWSTLNFFDTKGPPFG